MDQDRLTVRGVEPLSDAIFRIEFDRGGLAFTPGDCVALYDREGVESRPYSIASGTDEDVLRFIIRRMPHGVVSNSLAEREAGDEVKASPPFGWFRPGDPAKEGSFVFVATGTGIAPFCSYFRSAPEHPPAVLLWGVRTLADAVDREWVQQQAPLHLCVSRESVPETHHGRVTDLLDQLPIGPDVHYYLCGLDAMIDQVSDWLEARGTDLVRIHRECFFNSELSPEAGAEHPADT